MNRRAHSGGDRGTVASVKGGGVYIDPAADRLTLTAIMTGWIADAWGIDKTLLAESMKLAGVAGPRLTEAERRALDTGDPVASEKDSL